MKKGILYLSLLASVMLLASCSLFNKDVAVTGVKLNYDGVGLDEGETFTLKATVEPSNATNKNVIWSSEDENIATVKNGVITAVSTGKTNIAVITEDGGKKAVCSVTVYEETIKPNSDEPYVIENEDGTSFTITPADLGLANYWISKDKKTVYLGGKVVKSDDAVANGYDPESYTLTGNFKGKIVVSWAEVEVVLSGATIENENGPAITGEVKTLVSAKSGTTNYVKSVADSENEKSAAILIDDSLEIGGKGTLYVEGSACHGVKAKKVELKGSGEFHFQGTSDGSAVNCNSFTVKEDKKFTAYFANSKNGIKADNKIEISSGTFNFASLKTALKTDTKADDDEGAEKEHYITLNGGVFNYDSTVKNFASTEEGMYTTEGATINKN